MVLEVAQHQLGNYVTSEQPVTIMVQPVGLHPEPLLVAAAAATNIIFKDIIFTQSAKDDQ